MLEKMVEEYCCAGCTGTVPFAREYSLGVQWIDVQALALRIRMHFYNGVHGAEQLILFTFIITTCRYVDAVVEIGMPDVFGIERLRLLIDFVPQLLWKVVERRRAVSQHCPRPPRPIAKTVLLGNGGWELQGKQRSREGGTLLVRVIRVPEVTAACGPSRVAMFLRLLLGQVQLYCAPFPIHLRQTLRLCGNRSITKCREV